MARCEAPNCKMRTYAPTVEQVKMAKNNYVISFHKFPEDPDRRQSWIDASKKPSWKPPMFNSSLCSLHFCDDCFDENNDLHDHAVPSIFFDDFGTHMREIVKKLDMECKLDDDDIWRPSRKSCTPPKTEHVEVSVVPCEEVLIYDESPKKLGIENISIPELDETMSISTENNDKNPPVRVSGSSASKFYQNNSDKLKATSCDTLSKGISISLPKISPISVTSSRPAASSVKSNAPITEVFRCEPTARSTPQKSSILPSNVTKPPMISSPGSIPDKSAIVPSPGISSSRLAATLSAPTIRSTMPISTSANSSTKSTVTPQPVILNISSVSVTKPTLTPSTSVTSKPIVTSSVSAVSNTSTVRSNSSFSVMEPTTKSLVIQLLNIVKMANASDENRLKSGPTLNSYLVTSKCPDTDASEHCEILPSASVILNVANYVKAIKDESFVKPDNVDIICGSPAIFLLKNITVQECDPNMNCVYVITSENLLPHLYKMKWKSGVSTKSTPQQSTTTSSAAGMIIQKPLQVADLVSSANPKAVVPIQNRLCGSSDTTKPTTAPKRVTNLSNSSNKNASNSVSCAGPKSRPIDSKSNSDSVKLSGKNSTALSSFTTPSTSNLDAFVSPAEPPTIISGKVVLKPQTSGLVSHSPATQLPVNNSVTGKLLVKVPRIDYLNKNISASPPTKVSTSVVSSVAVPISAPKTSVSNTSICYNYLTKGSSNVSISSSTPAKPPTTASISHSVTITPVQSTNSSFKSPLAVSTSATPAQPLVNASISDPKGTFTKPSTNPSKTPTITITGSTLKNALSSVPILKTISTTSETPIARVIPSPLKSVASTSPAAQLSVQSDNANVLKSLPSFIIRGKDNALVRVPSNAVRAQVHTIASPTLVHVNGSPPSPCRNGISSSPASSAIRSQQLASNKATIPSESQLPASVSTAPSYTFQPIRSTSFDTNLKTSEVLITYDSFTSTPKQSTSLPSATKQTLPTIPSQNQSTVIPPLKRKWGEIDDSEDDDDDDDDDPFFANCNDEEYDKEYVEQQRKRISKCEANILQKEREINALKKKIQLLKKRLISVKDPRDTKTDEQLVEDILSKYIDSDGIQFFIGQMKVAGKTYTQFRWSEDDKLFALGLLYRNPVEYNVLFQKYTLPSDKTLNKFVSRVKKAEMEDGKGTISRK